MLNGKKVLNIANEFNFIQTFLNILGVQFFHFRSSKSDDFHEKPNNFRFCLMSLKLVSLFVLLGINLNDFQSRTLTGSSLMSAALLLISIAWSVLLPSCVVLSYKATRKIKGIYKNFEKTLNLLSYHSIEFDFVRFQLDFLCLFQFFCCVS